MSHFKVGCSGGTSGPRCWNGRKTSESDCEKMNKWCNSSAHQVIPCEEIGEHCFTTSIVKRHDFCQILSTFETESCLRRNYYACHSSPPPLPTHPHTHPHTPKCLGSVSIPFNSGLFIQSSVYLPLCSVFNSFVFYPLLSHPPVPSITSFQDACLISATHVAMLLSDEIKVMDWIDWTDVWVFDFLNCC